MIVTHVQTGTRREITSGTREWADHNVNCIKGCSNNCKYCYAKIIAKRFKRCTDETWKDMEIRNDIVGKKFKKYSGRVMFPSTHDILDIPSIKQSCFTVIGNLLNSGNDVLITSKPKLSVTKDMIAQFTSYKGTLQFRFTITSFDNDLLSFWEPNAPFFEERFDSLKYAYFEGFKTSVSIEPFLDSAPMKLVKMLLPYITESIWVGPMNYIPRNGISDRDQQQFTDIRRKYETNRLWEIYYELKDIPKIRFKDSMVNRLGIPRETDL